MRSIFSIIFLLSIAFVTLFSPAAAFAHSAGYSFEQKVGNYKIDIGYDTKPIEANAPVTFDFNIKDVKTDEYLDFGDAWVRFENENTTYFATGVYRQPLGATTLVYTFSKPGNYSMYVRFENKDQQIVEATIPITVNPNSEQDSNNPLFQLPAVAIGLVLGIVLGTTLLTSGLLLRKSLRKNQQQAKKHE